MFKFDTLPSLFYLVFYHPRNDDYYSMLSDLILGLKRRDWQSIEYFGDILKNLLEDEEVAIVAVPPHCPEVSQSGIRDLGNYLVKHKTKYINAIYCLHRFTNYYQSRYSEAHRTQADHLGSISSQEASLIKDKNVILIDDIITTGSSIRACEKILKQEGAKAVKIICLGRTIRDAGEYHYAVNKRLEDLITQIDDEADWENHKIEEKYKDLFDCLSQDISEDEYEDECEYLEKISDLYRSINEQSIQELGDVHGSTENQKTNYENWALQAHEVLCGNTHFTPDNPFIEIFITGV